MKPLEKNSYRLYFFLMLLIILSNGCKKDEDPVSLAVVVTSEVTCITPVSAVCSGSVTSTGISVLSRGICWSKGLTPTLEDQKLIDSSKGNVINVTLKGLQPNTTYYFRAFAINSAGTAYGESKFFKTPEGVIDIDGNGYTFVKIGTQTWMAQNLKVTHFANGDSIPCIYDSTEWGALSSAGCCDYENSASIGNTYGKLYNYMAVTNSRKLCPEGWHVPSYAEWRQLSDYLGGGYVSGGKLKEAGTAHWRKTQPEVKDSLGFSALPAGYRNYNDGGFGGLGVDCIFWSSSPESISRGIGMSMVDSLIYTYTMGGPKLTGLSVRCLKD